MSKALELTIYPKTAGHPSGYLVPTEMTSGRTLNVIHTEDVVDRASKAKRLTEAELAAEYWHAQSEYLQEATFVTTDEQAMARVGTFMEMQAAAVTLQRFATSPHYFEATE